MLITTVIGARPQFVKAAMVSRAFEKAGIEERLIHSGQHYDEEMSRIFFRELGLRQPEKNLEIGSGTHAEQTGKALTAIERDLNEFRPAAVLVYGDTNTTLASALAGSKLQIPVIHVEAGLRSFNRAMPEEINRVAADRMSTLLFAPTNEAVKNLKREGMKKNIFMVGDVMYDAVAYFGKIAEERSNILDILALEPRSYNLLTLHRPSNVDDAERLKAYMQAVSASGRPTVFPIHPRTRAILEGGKNIDNPNVRVIPPVGYLDMLKLQKYAKLVLTDSGGIQKEAYIQKVPCITLRTETEWKETTLNGWNRLLGEDISLLNGMMEAAGKPGPWRSQYGDGNAASKIAAAVRSFFER